MLLDCITIFSNTTLEFGTVATIRWLFSLCIKEDAAMHRSFSSCYPDIQKNNHRKTIEVVYRASNNLLAFNEDECIRVALCTMRESTRRASSI